MAKYILLTESPSKAKTIAGMLGSEFVVRASYGHVMDLPKDKLGFDADNDFKPDYNITMDKRKVVADIKSHLEKDTIVYLGSDFDREGHLISKHIVDILKLPKERYKRIEFHEITKQAIMHAIENPVELAVNLSHAAIARRVLDRAVGYELSPLLWKKVRRGLSAGRVQSVATRIIVDRELEIRAFVPEEYWKIKVDFINPSLRAELVKHNNKEIKITTELQAKNIELSLNRGSFQLVDIEEKDSIRNPSPPFTTSTLQQEASRKIGMSVKNTMSTAQQLYEGNVGAIPHHTGGLITYMRTDSLNLSSIALEACKEVIVEEYGKQYTVAYPRVFKNKSKGAQEAHEAIRPVNLKLKPSMVKPFLDPQQYRLYDLIWKRTIATQMTPAKIAITTYHIEAGEDRSYNLQSKGTRIVSPGYMLAYTEGSDDPQASLDTTDKILPNIDVKTYLNKDSILLEQKFTLPPARYTEASLVKKLEAVGVGRPSTFASTINTIMTRGYVTTDTEKKLIPTPIGETVTEFLKEHFPDIVDIQFTANIEKEFDDIADGTVKWSDVMKKFYTKFKANIIEKDISIVRDLSKKERLIGTDSNNKPITARTGRFGSFVQVGNKEDGDIPKYASIPDHLRLETITLEEALSLLVFPRVVGQDSKGRNILANKGKYGPYLQVEKNYYKLRQHDPLTIDLETSLQVIKDFEIYKANNPIDPNKPRAFVKGKKFKSFKKK